MGGYSIGVFILALIGIAVFTIPSIVKDIKKYKNRKNKEQDLNQ